MTAIETLNKTLNVKFHFFSFLMSSQTMVNLIFIAQSKCEQKKTV